MEAQEIGIAIGLVIAASLALQSALGPAMNSIVQAIKDAGYAEEGRAGLISLAIGAALGSAAGLLGVVQSDEHNLVWIGVGAFAGLVGLGAGGVRSHLVVRGLQQPSATSSQVEVVALEPDVLEPAAEDASLKIPALVTNGTWQSP